MVLAAAGGICTLPMTALVAVFTDVRGLAVAAAATGVVTAVGVLVLALRRGRSTLLAAMPATAAIVVLGCATDPELASEGPVGVAWAVAFLVVPAVATTVLVSRPAVRCWSSDDDSDDGRGPAAAG